MRTNAGDWQALRYSTQLQESSWMGRQIVGGRNMMTGRVRSKVRRKRSRLANCPLNRAVASASPQRRRIGAGWGKIHLIDYLLWNRPIFSLTRPREPRGSRKSIVRPLVNTTDIRIPNEDTSPLYIQRWCILYQVKSKSMSRQMRNRTERAGLRYPCQELRLDELSKPVLVYGPLRSLF